MGYADSANSEKGLLDRAGDFLNNSRGNTPDPCPMKDSCSVGGVQTVVVRDPLKQAMQDSQRDALEYLQTGCFKGVLCFGPATIGSVGPKLVAGMGGRFGNLIGEVGDNLTAHHIPQAALNFTSRVDGGAIVMTAEEHAMTRTFSFKGALTKTADAAESFRDVLAKDIKDVRSIAGSRYNEGLKAVTEYYEKHFPELMKKD